MLAATRHAEVEVGEVRDPQAAQLLRQPAHAHVTRVEPYPSRLEPRPPERGGGDPGESSQACVFSRTGATETTCRLKRSSDSSSPAATPISCDRWRIGIRKSFPVVARSFDCHASSER